MPEDRLVPLTHELKSKRARAWSLSGAIEELLDNSFLHGHATKISVVISNTNGIGIIDNGDGIDDINRIFQFGNSSAYHDLENIAQYGIGATDALIYLGDKACVETVRFGHKHKMIADWAEIEKSGKWPLRYTGKGEQPKKGERGTTIIITKLHKFYQLVGSEKLARDLSVIFAPALRKGACVEVYHRLKAGDDQHIKVEPFIPNDLTDETQISGTIKTKDGTELRWNGHAGLSASLLELFNCVHLAFGHRVIEMTRDPFFGNSAPTLYIEVHLDPKTPWKYQLSDHKDKVVHYRDELMESINTGIKVLLEKSKKQASDLALRQMTAEIMTPINKALKSVGALTIDPEEEGIDTEIGTHVGDENGGEDGDEGTKTEMFDLFDGVGEQGKAVKRPTGIKIDYSPKARMEGRAFTWEINNKLMTITLEEEMFTAVLGWPPKIRDKHVIHLVISFLAHAMDMMFWDQTASLRKAVSKKLFAQIEGWSGEPNKIAPYLYRELMEGTDNA